MPLLPFWALVVCSRVKFTFTFSGHASSFGELTFNKIIPVIEFDVDEKISVLLLKFPCLRLTEKNYKICSTWVGNAQFHISL